MAEYLVPQRHVTPTYPTIQAPPPAVKMATGIMTTGTARTIAELTTAPATRLVPTIGIRGDGTAGPIPLGPVAIETDPGAGVGTVAPLAAAIAAARSQDDPTAQVPSSAQIPGYQAGGSIQPANASSSGVPPWLWLAGGIAGVGLLGLGVYALTR